MCCILLCFVIIYHLGTATAGYSELENMVDLTWSFGNNTIYWKDNQPFVFGKKMAEISVDSIWYSTSEFCVGEQGGTHFDAPYHFNKHGWKVNEIPLSRLIAVGINVDLTNEVKDIHKDVQLLPKHLEEWEKKNGAIPDKSVILVNFGWLQYYNRVRQLTETKNIGLNYPGISTAAAEWIIRKKKVVGVGVDSPSIDSGKCINFATHKLLSKHQIYMLENVNIPTWFPANGFVLYIMPMKIADGSGAPLRVVAVPLNTGVLPGSLDRLRTPWYGHVIVVVCSIALFFIYATNWME